MKNKLLKNPQHVAQMGYNPFTLHRSVDRTDTVGQLTPCYSALLKAGDKIDASVSIRTRTMPLLAPASASLHQCVDWFFVPLNQILQQFGNWLENIRDEKSDFYADLTAINSPQNLPCYNPGNLFVYLQQDLALDNDAHMNDAQDSLRLADCLGIPVAYIMDDWNSAEGWSAGPASFTNKLNVFFPAAYQKIYYDFYRLSDREKNDPQAYNFDTYMKSSNSPTSLNEISSDRLLKLFKLHYVPYRKDYFTNLFISPIQGQKDLSSYGINPAQVNQWLTSLDRLSFYSPANPNTPVINAGPVTFTDSNPSTIGFPYSNNSNNVNGTRVGQAFTAVNPPNISSMFAIQKMLEISRRAGKHFDAQTLAHYGVNVPTGISGEVMHLGHHEQPFIIGDVISTAETEESPLGEMAGKGYSSGTMENHVRFEAPFHGVLMAIHYVIPDVVYEQSGFEKEQTYITPADWPRPETDSLGMQPLFGYECQPLGYSSGSDVVGWQYRYQELKMKYNVAYGGVHPKGTLHYWALSRYKPVDNTLNSFLVPPTYLNDIMVNGFSYDEDMANERASASGTGTYVEFDYSRLYVNDPLVTHFDFNVKKSSKMSTYGLLPL